MKITVEFKWQYMWMGCQFRYDWNIRPGYLTRRLWICLIPMFPIHIQWGR